MNAAEDEARSARLRARTGRGAVGVGDEGDSPEVPCAAEKTKALWSGALGATLLVGGVGALACFVLYQIGYEMGITDAIEATPRRERLKREQAESEKRFREYYGQNA